MSTLKLAVFLPGALLVLASACSTSPDVSSLGGRPVSGEDDATGKKKTAPPKKSEPTQTPAPKGDTPPPSTPQPDQAPTLASISPDSITVGQSPAGIELTLNGTRFVAGAQVDIAGTKLPATFVSAQQIKVQVPADKVKQAGALRLAVVAKPGLESNPLSFTVANPTTVTIATLTPASAVLGEAARDVPIDVTGTGFTAQSLVRFNGAALATTFTSGTALKATIPAIAFTSSGRFSVTVSTGTDVFSLPSPFEVRNPAPTATKLVPASVTVGDSATVVSVTGTNFTKATEVMAQNTPLATTFVSSTQIRATVPSFLLANAGSVSLVVTTGAPGGGSATAQTLTVKAGQSTNTGATCAYKCGDYGYKPFTCYSNWYCIGTGDTAGCLAQIPCTDTDLDVGNPNEKKQDTCTYKCTDYQYASGECSDGWYCRYTDGCLVEDNTCAAGANNKNVCTYGCADYGYVKGECTQGYYCQYADGCLVQDASCNDNAAAANSCTYPCETYGYAAGDCHGGYYCQRSDSCLVEDDECN